MSALRSKRSKNAPSLVCLFVLVSIVGTLIAPSTARAHKVNVFAYVEGDTVITESYFNDGRKCRDSTIEVFDNRRNKLVGGKTDTDGRFSFKPSVRTDLVIRLTASMGHRAEYRIPSADLPESLSVAPETSEKMAENRPAHAHSEAAEDVSALLAGKENLGPSEVEQVVEKVVARQLAPIRRALEESRRRQRFSDVVGGIGYIVGLMGLVLYFRSKRRQ